MRIAFVSNVVYPFVTGGAEKRIHEIGTRLADRGHDVTVYGRHFWDGPDEITHSGMTLQAVAPAADLYNDDRRSIAEAIDFAARALPPLRRQLRNDEHDVVVASVFPYFPVLSTKLAALGTDTPLVTTWHEVWGEYWEKYLGSLAIFGKVSEHMTARTPQHPIAISGITADRLAEIGPDRDDIAVVPNGSTPNRYGPRRAPTRGTTCSLRGDSSNTRTSISCLRRSIGSASIAMSPSASSVMDQKKSDSNRSASRLRTGTPWSSSASSTTTRTCWGICARPTCSRHRAPARDSDSRLLRRWPRTARLSPLTTPDSAADEVIGDAGFLTDPTVDGIAETLAQTLTGGRPAVDPVERAQRFDWNTVASQAETVYRRVADGDSDPIEADTTVGTSS